MKKVSIIIPAFNVVKYLSDCIECIIHQTYKNIEIIIVNDGSTDGTQELCEKLSFIDNRIRVINKENGGLSSARNAGLKIASGDYISFVDSDDLIPSNFIEELLYALTCTKSDISVCKIQRFDDETNKILDTFYPFKDGKYTRDEYICSILLHKVDNASVNKIYKKDVLSNIIFREGIINEDFPFIISVLEQVNSIVYTNKTQYLYRRRQGSITQTVKSNIYDFIENAKDVMNTIDKRFIKQARAYLYYETVNCISCIILSSNSKSLKLVKQQCQQIINSNIIDFIFNPYCSNKQKLKYLLTKNKRLFKFTHQFLKK